jgi:diguanylate cyclase (GGDEF)-like protein
VITAPTQLRIPRFRSIRSKILAFAVLAALLPTGLTLWIWYAQNRASLEMDIARELRSQSAQTAREIGVWLRERVYDLRMVANDLSAPADPIRGASASATAQLRDSLVSFRARVSDVDDLLAIDLDGRLIAASTPSPPPVPLPENWLQTLHAEHQVVGEAYWDPVDNRAKLLLIVPLYRAPGEVAGALAASVNLVAAHRVLRRFAGNGNRVVALATSSRGALIASSRESSPRLLTTAIRTAPLARLMSREGEAFRYTSDVRRPRESVIGALSRVPHATWVVVAETSENAAFTEMAQFRNIALILVAAAMVVIALGAYRLGLAIVEPLDQLMHGAARVASGDLAVDLPPPPVAAGAAAGEVGQLTAAFNHMVWRLRESRRQLDATNEMLRRQNAELERVSLTDGLTGLANHRLLVQRLGEETSRYHRHGRPFSVLVADVDNFKSYNERFGHPAGDDALRHVATFLRAVTRQIDCVARHGGDEFCLLLPEATPQEVARLADRIRQRLKTAPFPGEPITLSLGAASLPMDGVTPDGVLAAADDALYQAKREGRDRFVQAVGV